jgi:hypothetical protein
MMRERLPDRREAELVDFTHAGRRWTLTTGRFPDGRVGEVFLDTPKASALGEIAADAAAASGSPAESRMPRACEPPQGGLGRGAGADRGQHPT